MSVYDDSSIYFPPPPPFIGGRGPYIPPLGTAAFTLPPTPAAGDNPPGLLADILFYDIGRRPLPPRSPFFPWPTAAAEFIPYTVEWLPSVLSAWQPPDVTPTLLRRLTPPSVDNPPPLSEGRGLWLSSILSTWQPPDPQPTQQQKLSPGIPGQSVDPPPVVYAGRRALLPSVIASWQPPDPPPTLPKNLSPGIPGQSVDNPPGIIRQPVQWPDAALQPIINRYYIPAAPAVTVQPYAAYWLSGILSSWLSQDPLPTLPRQLNPSILNVIPDNPPFGLLVTVIEPWLVTPDLPQLPQKFPQAGITPPPPTADNPPGLLSDILFYDVGRRPLPQRSPFFPQPAAVVVTPQIPYSTYSLQVILEAWQPLDPQPTLPIKLIPPSVDRPPIKLAVAPEPYTWLPPDPLPTLPIKLTPPSVDLPPFVNVGRWKQNITARFAWEPPDPQPVQRGPLNPSFLAVTVNNPPFRYPGRNPVMGPIVASWQPPDPQPTQRGPLSPFFTAVPVNNPPFSYMGRWVQTISIISDWDPPPYIPVQRIPGNPGSGPTPPPPVIVGDFTVSGREVSDIFPVYDVSYTYAGITKRTN